MERETITELWPGAVVIDLEPLPDVGVEPFPVVEYAPDITPAVRGAIGRILRGAPASFEIVERCGAVASVRIIPRAVVDPIIPVAWCAMPVDHYSAMRWMWRALLPAVNGWRVGRWRRSVRVVLRTLNGLTDRERDFFEARLWASVLGDSI